MTLAWTTSGVILAGAFGGAFAHGVEPTVPALLTVGLVAVAGVVTLYVERAPASGARASAIASVATASVVVLSLALTGAIDGRVWMYLAAAVTACYVTWLAHSAVAAERRTR